jgi:hypothetical protein
MYLYLYLVFVFRWSKSREMFKYEDFNVFSCHSQSVSQNIFEDIEEVKVLSKAAYESIKSEADSQIGLQVLHLFITDILGRDSVPAKIFLNKARHDFHNSFVVKVLAKNLACAALVVFNIIVAMIATLLTKDKTSGWQNSFVIACVIQFVLEGVYTTNDCILWHYSLPNYICEELKASVRTMVSGIDHALECASLWKDKNRMVPSLETTSYFFVSRQVAAKFPHVLECSVVLAFMSIFPRGKLAQHFKPTEVILSDTSRGLVGYIWKLVSLSTVIGGLVTVVGQLPAHVQIIVIRAAQPLLLSLFLVMAVAIYYNKTLIFIPIIIVVYIVVGLRMKKTTKHTLVLPLVFKSMQVEDDDVDSDSDVDRHDDDYTRTRAESEGKRLDEASSSVRAQNRWGSIKSSVVSEKKPNLMKELVGKAKAQKLAIDQYNTLGKERTNDEMLSVVDDSAVDRIANLIVESSGVTMEMARSIARSEIEKQLEQVRRNDDDEHNTPSRQRVQTTEPMSYVDMTLSRASSGAASASWSKARRAFNSDQLVSKTPTMASIMKQQQEAAESLRLAERMQADRTARMLAQSDRMTVDAARKLIESGGRDVHVPLVLDDVSDGDLEYDVDDDIFDNSDDNDDKDDDDDDDAELIRQASPT